MASSISSVTPKSFGMGMPMPPDAAGSTRTSAGAGGSGTRASFFNASTPNKTLKAPPQPFDLGLLKAGYLRKYNPGPLPRPQKRYAVLTERRLHWFKREASDDLFGQRVGCVGVREITKVMPRKDDSLAFEVCAGERRRVFRAAEEGERDAWVQAILEAVREERERQQQDGNSLAAALETPRTFMLEDELVVDVVSYKTLNTEAVVARTPSCGTTLRLPPIHNDALVMVWLRSGSYAAVEGREVARAVLSHSPDPMQIVLSDGSATVSLLFFREGQPKPWFRQNEVIAAWAVALLALYGWCMLSVLVLGYVGFLAYSLHQQSTTSIGHVDMVITSLEANVDEDALKRAASLVIPPKYITGCQGDMIEARRRWDITRKWREDYKIDTVLDSAHPHFFNIKKHWPHFFLPNSINGEPVYLERTGEFKMPKMLAAGITVDDLLHHCVFTTEFLYQHLMEDYNTQKLITVYDLGGANLGDLKGEAQVFMKRALGFMQLHYIERSRVIILANAPGWLPILWRILRPMLNEVTAQKIRIASTAETYKAMSEFMAPENIPVEYGGKLKFGEGKDGCRYHSPPEVKMYDLVKKLNALHPEVKKPMKVYE